ncbi:MAG: hypothetical protein P0120_19460 [Nitrospira sp.]|nr:hypothetical protein [Nitrospira sp.]
MNGGFFRSLLEIVGKSEASIWAGDMTSMVTRLVTRLWDLFQDASIVVSHGEYEWPASCSDILPGCHSTQDSYLGQATDHATPVELEQILRHSSRG